MTQARIPQPGDLVHLSGDDALWYVTRRQDYTMSLMQVYPRFGDWLITDTDDASEVMAPDHWNLDE